jgi:uncharacterized protein (DUF608 family)
MDATWNTVWPVICEYDADHLSKIAMPLGGIGTGTVSLGGRGNLRDWEIMNRPAKGYVPSAGRGAGPGFVLHTVTREGKKATRLLEGPLELHEYEGGSGSGAPNHGLPRFANCSFASSYPLSQILLTDHDVPVAVRLEAFNPLVPADADASGIPVAVLRYTLVNTGSAPVEATVCGSMPNFIGRDGSQGKASKNRNELRSASGLTGIVMMTDGVPADAAQWGTMALACAGRDRVTTRTAWREDAGWGSCLLDFWDDLTQDGALDERPSKGRDVPMASIAAQLTVPPEGEASATFLIAWHFPNRMTWTPCKTEGCCDKKDDVIGNYYSTRYADAWDVAEKVIASLDDLERKTVEFVSAFCSADLPAEVKEAALFNLSTLRSQTCFRTPDGRFYGWEGCGDGNGCCHGSCTHVWNYEHATAFLFGELSRSMREVEFAHATTDNGHMRFRVNLPLSRALDFGKAAADGQMGCIMKLYRDWQLSGDDGMLRDLWPKARACVEFCWIPGGWDADRDGVMEGCQHNTMDVEYYGPNPQMTGWYLGALRAAEEMARHIGDTEFADECRRLFASGSAWMDANLFNGEYYEHHVTPPKNVDDIAEGLRLSMGAADLSKPDYQLGEGCLVDQLVGQYTAHVCGLGYLHDRESVKKTYGAILKHNRKQGFRDHFNCMRSYVLGDESALLMAAYPKTRPQNPFPYFTEVMTGFEYTAAVGMIQEGMVDEGLQCIRDIRARYDGRKRSPFDEAECGHHYARAMASWAAVLAPTGFRYSGTAGRMTFASTQGRSTAFWSTGNAWGTAVQTPTDRGATIELRVIGGTLRIKTIAIEGIGEATVEADEILGAGAHIRVDVQKKAAV